MSTYTNIAPPQPDYDIIEKNDRRLRIKNSIRENKINQNSWIVSQRALYPNSIQKINDTDDSLLKQEISFQDSNPDVYLERFKLNLLKLSGNDSDISNYVAEHLSDSEIRTLVSYWSRFIKLVKEHFPKGVSKETLVSFARDFASNPSNINSVIKRESNEDEREICQDDMSEIRQRERSISKNLEASNWIATYPTGTSYEIESQSEYDIPSWTSRLLHTKSSISSLTRRLLIEL